MPPAGWFAPRIRVIAPSDNRTGLRSWRNGGARLGFDSAMAARPASGTGAGRLSVSAARAGMHPPGDGVSSPSRPLAARVSAWFR
jgi:hypothetical protein